MNLSVENIISTCRVKFGWKFESCSENHCTLFFRKDIWIVKITLPEDFVNQTKFFCHFDITNSYHNQTQHFLLFETKTMLDKKSCNEVVIKIRDIEYTLYRDGKIMAREGYGLELKYYNACMECFFGNFNCKF